MKAVFGSSSQGATSHRAPAAGQLWAPVPGRRACLPALGTLLLLAFGCQPALPSSALQAGSAPAAERVVREVLDAAVARGSLRGLCDQSPPGTARAAAAIGALSAYSIDHVEPAWVGAEPYFRVDVTLRRADAEERRSVAVRAREGCVERLWGAPLPTALRPEEGELSL